MPKSGGKKVLETIPQKEKYLESTLGKNKISWEHKFCYDGHH